MNTSANFPSPNLDHLLARLGALEDQYDRSTRLLRQGNWLLILAGIIGLLSFPFMPLLGKQDLWALFPALLVGIWSAGVHIRARWLVKDIYAKLYDNERAVNSLTSAEQSIYSRESYDLRLAIDEEEHRIY